MHTFRSLIILCLATATLACAKGSRTESPMPAGPTITSLSPVSGQAGIAYPIQITLIGTGFAPEGNLVTFGDITIENLTSTLGGTHLTFSAPKEEPGAGEVPPFVLQPGAYAVTVTTAHGTSNSIDFALTRGPQ